MNEKIDIKALRGVRAWSFLKPGYLAYDGGEHLLEHGEREVVADGCRVDSTHLDPPVASCSCGLYVLRSLEDDRHVYVGQHTFWSDVELYGHVLEHELGYRTQYMRLVNIQCYSDNKYAGVLDYLGAAYGVPVVLNDKFPFDPPQLARRVRAPRLHPTRVQANRRTYVCITKTGVLWATKQSDQWAVLLATLMRAHAMVREDGVDQPVPEYELFTLFESIKFRTRNGIEVWQGPNGSGAMCRAGLVVLSRGVEYVPAG
jgi:hypothetical protein